MKKLLLALLICLLPSVIQAQSISTTVCPGAGCVDFNVAGQGSIGIQVTGTWMGTITFQSSIDGTNFVSILVFPSDSTTGVTTTTSNGAWSTAIAGFNTVRVVFTVYTSGTAVVVRRTTTAAKNNPGGGGGAGTVTSVGLVLPTSVFDVSGSPVVAAGDLTATFDTQTANTVFSGPAMGGAATPTFRALAAADLPAGTGTVTSIATTSPITGGPITTTGTIACGTCGVTGSPLSQFAATTSAQLFGVLSDETGGTGVAVGSVAPALTGSVVITEAIGSSALNLTGATQTLSFPVINATQTWNAAGVTFTGLKLNITNTTSAAGSMLADLQVGGTSQFKVSKTGGGITVVGGDAVNSFTTGSGTLGFNLLTRSDYGGVGYQFVVLRTDAQPIILSSTTDFAIPSNLYLSSTDFPSDRDVALKAEAANILSLRRTTNAQTYRLYETFTDGTNYERGALTLGSNLLTIAWETAGTGSDDGGIALTPAGVGFVTTTAGSFATSGSGMAVANVGANSCGTTAATIAGNNNNGEVTVGATAGTQCRITFTKAAPNRWDCSANDETTGNIIRATYVDTTHVDLLGTMVAADVINYICVAR